MYIAFKWLLSLTLIMWIAMCCIDVFVKKKLVLTEEGFNIRPLTLNTLKNNTEPLRHKLNLHTKRLLHIGDNNLNMVYLHCFMFIAGALVVSLYSNINVIMFILKRELNNIKMNVNANTLREHYKTAVVTSSKIVITLLKKSWQKLKILTCKSKYFINKLNLKRYHKQRINFILLKKIKELNEERKNLSQLLLAAIRENKNVRMQYQLENMAKKRLVRHIENTEKVIKENRSRYVSFQQLYLVTHQENSFLKSRVKKITKDKEEVEGNFSKLLNEIYKSRNTELINYCRRFIVPPRNNLLKIDVSAEIQKFLHTPRASAPLNWQLSEYPNIDLHAANSWLRCSSTADIAEDFNNKGLMPLLSEAPKLKGLPGECVWTIKDKDGLIEKLYECDYGSDGDTGDIIGRIREYTVYHDKDCLLDFSNSSSSVGFTTSEHIIQREASCHSNIGLNGTLTRQKFLTGSEAFKKFMENNNSVFSRSIMLPTPRIVTD